MRSRSTLGAGAIVVVLALLAGGCGGHHAKPLTKAEYVKQMKAIGTSLGKPLRKFTLDSSPKPASKDLRAVQIDLRRAVTRLNGMAPPDKAKAPHARLATALSELADELDPIIAKLAAGNAQAAAKVLATKGFKDLRSASSAIVAAGFPIASA